MRERLAADVGTRTLAEVLALARDHDLPVGPAEARDDPESVAQVATRVDPTAPPWRACVPLPDALVTDLGPAPAR